MAMALTAALLTASCEKMLVENQPAAPEGSRLLLYMHSATLTPPDIDFTISHISVEAEDGRVIRAAEGPVDVSSKVLVSGQALISEAFVPPGAYKGIRVGISRASIKRHDGRASLGAASSQEVFVKAGFSLLPRESTVVSVEWNPDASVERAHLFQPSFIAEGQSASSRGLLLFVSNSGSNYISIIDRSLERVIGAITVGDLPTGMALNSKQDLLYVVNSGSRSISVIETAHMRVLDTIPLSAGVRPTEVAFIPDSDTSIDGKLYVINQISNDVTVVSTQMRRIMKTIPVGTSPSSVLADQTRKEVYVTNERSNNLSIINAADDTVASTVNVDKRPVGMILGKDKLYVLNEGSATATVVSQAQRRSVSTISFVDPPKKGIQKFNGRTFITNASAGSMTFLNPLDVTTRNIRTGRLPIGIAGDELRNRLYAAESGDDSVCLADPIGEKIVKRLFVGKRPYSVVLLDQ